MPDEIRIRMVPKTRDGRSIVAEALTLAPDNAKANRPDRGRANEAKRIASDLGVQEVQITRHGSVDGMLPRQACEKLFGTTFRDTSEPLLDAARKATGVEPFSVQLRQRVEPTSELSIPKGLEDLIAFAYIPTPVEFFAESYIPPDVENYHLELLDVANALHAPSSHRNGWTGRGVRIAMTDTGFGRHPYFDRQGYGILRASTPSTQNPEIDTNGHGTGESANVLFMAPDSVLIGIKHNDYSAEALETALQHDPDIITNSWGWDIDFMTWAQLQQSDPNLYNEARDLENIINDAIDDGVLIVFAAGNGHRAFPASMPGVLAAGGVSVERDGSLKASSYASSFRSTLYPGRRVPDVCGVVGEAGTTPLLPGHIMLPVPDGSTREGDNMPANVSADGWGIFSGTSAASPQVAGIAALLLSTRHNGRNGQRLGPSDVASILQSTAIDVTTGTTRNGDTAVVGRDDATGSGFVNAAEASALIANGTIRSGIVAGVTDAWRSVDLPEGFGPAIGLLAAMQTFNGHNTAAVRIRQPTQTGFRLKIEEEQSQDPETSHVPEDVAYLALEPGFLFNRHAVLIGEIGTLDLEQPDRYNWQQVRLKHRYENPVVIAQLMTFSGSQPAHTRIRNVQGSSFELQVEEWGYLNGMHPEETIAYLVVERGLHELPAGTVMEVGSVNTNHGWASVVLTGAFGSAPIVVSSSQTYNGNQEIVTRQRNVTAGGFDVRLQEEENRDGVHLVETVGWVATEL